MLNEASVTSGRVTHGGSAIQREKVEDGGARMKSSLSNSKLDLHSVFHTGLALFPWEQHSGNIVRELCRFGGCSEVQRGNDGNRSSFRQWRNRRVVALPP